MALPWLPQTGRGLCGVNPKGKKDSLSGPPGWWPEGQGANGEPKRDTMQENATATPAAVLMHQTIVSPGRPSLRSKNYLQTELDRPASLNAIDSSKRVGIVEISRGRTKDVAIENIEELAA